MPYYSKDYKTIQGITLTFENCETAYIPITEIRGLYLGKITENFGLCNENKTYYFKYCNIFSISFNDLLQCTYQCIMGYEPENKNLFNRLKNHNDITHVEISFVNEDPEYIAVPWKGKHYINHYQVLRKKNNNYYIHISSHWTIHKIVNFIKYQYKVVWFKIKKFFRILPKY